MTYLLANWRMLASVGLVAVVLAFTYRIGGNAPRAELKALRAAAEAYRAESARIAKEKDREYSKELDRVRSDWADWMRRHPAKARGVDSRVCADSAGNEQLSAAVSAYIGEVERFRADTAELLAEADRQRAALTCAAEWAGTVSQH